MSRVVQCFLLTPTARAVRSLRRFIFSSDGQCPGVYGYHTAEVAIDEVDYPAEKAEFNGYEDSDFPHDDPRWPAACACGHAFTDKDHWQANIDRLFARSDGGAPTTLDDAPPGAMWFADWYDSKGPDGRCLVVRCPGDELCPNDWIVDQTGHSWERTGEPPRVTARPSILFHGRRIAGVENQGGYHGFLTDGRLEEC